MPIFLVILAFITACSSQKTVTNQKKESLPEAPLEMPKVVVEEASPVSPLPPPAPEPEDIKEYITRPKSPAMREFRAAWIATVANINWPSKAGLSTAEQQREAIALLDFLHQHNYNAVIFQVRPQADALYLSILEPWSIYLTGEQGKAPEPFYDPLQFWIHAAHERGMELHVWLNPYRAHHSTGGKVTGASLVSQKPHLMTGLKNGMWWMNPSLQETQDHTAAVVMDIVKRYDIDGVHFDDYFYPYASYNKGEDFPDTASYNDYLAKGGTLARGDWRRANVNLFVERIYKEIKAEKPQVKFGISPFGIYRPGYPASIKGMDQFSELYADARLWLNKGWIDYYSPQLYWKIGQTAQSFPVLLGWWENENTHNRHLWPGINIDFGGDEPNVIETVSQIMITRGMLPESKGSIHWSIGPLLKYPNVSKGILETAYKKPALVPSSPWLDAEVPKVPVVNSQLVVNKLNVSWNHDNAQDIFRWVVYYKYDNGPWEYKVLSKNERAVELPKVQEGRSATISHIAVTAVNRSGNESDLKEIQIR
ncbi:family 10 glycosylhydrolase [Antarcticibacterium sp. W02-3]|nr:family 10 glycosylhydrolase [Antarcticibacterium sp. W02-3]